MILIQCWGEVLKMSRTDRQQQCIKHMKRVGKMKIFMENIGKMKILKPIPYDIYNGVLENFTKYELKKCSSDDNVYDNKYFWYLSYW